MKYRRVEVNDIKVGDFIRHPVTNDIAIEVTGIDNMMIGTIRLEFAYKSTDIDCASYERGMTVYKLIEREAKLMRL